MTNKKVFEFIVNRIHNNDNDLITLLSRIFNPKRNDFELTLIEDYHYKLGEDIVSCNGSINSLLAAVNWHGSIIRCWRICL